MFVSIDDANKDSSNVKNKPDIQKLCSFSREGNALFTKTKSPVALYISKIMELRSGGWLHRKIRLYYSPTPHGF